MVKDIKPSTDVGHQSGTPGPGSYVAPSDFGHLDFGNKNSPRANQDRNTTMHSLMGSQIGSRPNS